MHYISCRFFQLVAYHALYSLVASTYKWVSASWAQTRVAIVVFRHSGMYIVFFNPYHASHLIWINRLCKREEGNKKRLSHFESLIFLANHQIHFLKKKRNNGVSRFSGVKCLIKNNGLTFSFETFMCAWFETVHPSASLQWRICPINIDITQVDKHKPLELANFLSLSLSTLVGWSLNPSRQKNFIKKKGKWEKKIKFARLKTKKGSFGNKKKQKKTCFGQINRLNE